MRSSNPEMIQYTVASTAKVTTHDTTDTPSLISEDSSLYHDTPLRIVSLDVLSPKPINDRELKTVGDKLGASENNRHSFFSQFPI
mmetsp:Transcript_21375/g.42825  ORF Transcript_21375/g.42825 Transcript_21375/m.42825 type:complete len:85 (-) Transcript_21375:499-753(-)